MSEYTAQAATKFMTVVVGDMELFRRLWISRAGQSAAGVISLSAALMFTLFAVCGSTQFAQLTDQQIDEAIAVGQRGDVPVARARSLDFDVYVEGPIGRIATAAQKASKDLRPFTRASVTEGMKEPLYRVFLVSRTNHDVRSTPNHIVLMPKGAKGVEDALQPIRENGRTIVWEAFFDRLPADEFDVVVVASSGQRHYKIDARARARIH